MKMKCLLLSAWLAACGSHVGRAQVAEPPTPQIANCSLIIRCVVTPESRGGVILAHGGRRSGYALHLEDGRPIFSVRIENELFTAAATSAAPAGTFSIEARLERDGEMTLVVDGEKVATGKAPGVIDGQPVDPLSIGEDVRTAVGNYRPPNSLKGRVSNVDVQATPAAIAATFHDSPNRWPAEKANAWHAKQPWLVGANFVPSTAINQLEMWQADTFDPETIDRELGWAAGIGMNTMRVFLHDIPWREDKDGFFKRIDRYLEIADKHGIRTMFVFFDSVWHPHPKAGRQPDPVPGVHNSGWVQSPGRVILEDRTRHDELKPYVVSMLSRYKNDPRVVVWDLFNEPDNANTMAYGRDGLNIDLPKPQKERLATELLRKAFAWAREVNPSQPVTAGVWLGDYLNNPSLIQRLSLEESDVISFHCYEGPDEVLKRIEGLKKLGRPLLCKEFMARGKDSRFENILPVLHEHNVAAYNWGLVDGKSQTIYPWDSWKKPYTSEPDPWFHDVFRRDGTPYSKAEVDLIKRLAGSKRSKAAISPAAQSNYGVAPCDSPALQIPAGTKPLIDYWMRDTYVTLGPDGAYYLTGTTADPDRKFDEKGPHCWDWNDGLYLWRSSDLKNWGSLGLVWSLDKDATWQKEFSTRRAVRHGTGYMLDAKRRAVWAPELHYIRSAKNWFYVACMNDAAPQKGSFILRSTSGKPEGPYENIPGNAGGPIFPNIDGSLFQDDDGSVWFIGHNHYFARMKPDMSGLAEEPRRFTETGYEPEPYIEGAFIFKHAGKYHLVHAIWSFKMPDGTFSYDAGSEKRGGVRWSYDCVIAAADKLAGPYGPRYTAGAGIGHNNLFQDRQGNWFATHFGNPRGSEDFKQPFYCRPAVIPMHWNGERFAPKQSVATAQAGL